MRLLLTLLTILSFLSLLASGAYYAYGYGVEYFQQAVNDAEEKLEDDAPIGTHVTLESFYYAKNFQSIAVKYTYGDEFGFVEDTMYATILIPSMEINYTAYTEGNFPSESYELLPEMLLTDQSEVVKQNAITYAIIS